MTPQSRSVLSEQEIREIGDSLKVIADSIRDGTIVDSENVLSGLSLTLAMNGIPVNYEDIAADLNEA